VTRFVIADTGPLFALNARDDGYTSRAMREMTAIRSEGGQVYVPQSTVLETYSLMMRQIGISRAQRWLNEVRRRTGIIPLDEQHYAEAFTLVLKYPDQDITLFDALLHVVSTRTGIPVWTYDHHFDILGTARWYAND
jgi:predicted nucleic acid-binding protein